MDTQALVAHDPLGLALGDHALVDGERDVIDVLEAQGAFDALTRGEATRHDRPPVGCRCAA